MTGQRAINTNQLTRRQAAAVHRASGQAAKAALRKSFATQNAGQHKASAPRPQRPPAYKAHVPRPVIAGAFNAFDKYHLPVDEVTAPYAVTNFQGVMEFTSLPDKDQVALICPRLLHQQERYTGPMTDIIAVLYDGAEVIGSNMADLGVLRSHIIDIPDMGTENQYTSVRARLHKLSVKVECLGSNTGLYPQGGIYLGAVPMIESGSFSAGASQSLTVKQAWVDDSVVVGYLRSCPGAQLLNHPVKLDAAIAENVSYKAWNDMAVPKDTVVIGSLNLSTALEPIVVYVPRTGAGDTRVQYRVSVGQQWCSRHPNNVMLRATQRQYPATAPDVWHRAVASVKDVGAKLAEQAGRGAVDALLARSAAAASLGVAAVAA